MSQAPDTSFVPRLDARQRAMLAEMGVRVWAPRTRPTGAAEATSEPPVAAPRPAPAPVAAASPPAATGLPVPATVMAQRPARAGEVQSMDWATLRETVAQCQACGLCKSRKNTVFGVGDEQADWMIVGEAPGENEDLRGEPFVGAAGQLLDNMLLATGRSRDGRGAEGAYIANVLKCRPPANRNPQPEEVVQCEPYLARQVALVKPRVIVAMGRFAVQSLLKTTEPIGRLRGRVHRYEGVPVIVSYHPAYLLRTPLDKGKAWADLCLAMHVMEQPPAGD
ncbi:uracil-DNA glycosylase [Hydrogenophaga sp.]|uniref:uracil-DNA glycosylase n=1 Tax=Hydrogenophaga sp. TaxID=1904254 RepID=UPI0026164D37|nr:uracil-DNA glycosylase [Hydrogenophaga sp.]MCW5653967.1 uracil-DNA glycosylase [Hydrogenophaga sp.]